MSSEPVPLRRKSLTVLPLEAPPRGEFDARLAAIRDELHGLEGSAVREQFSLLAADRLLKTTISLCPQCLSHVPAAVFVRSGRVLAAKRCPAHGASLAVFENDENYYHLSNRDRWGRRYSADRILDFPAYSDSGCCGAGETCGDAAATADADLDFSDQMGNKSCTVLVEVTNACNLACPVCYSDAKGDRKLPLDAFQRYLSELVEAKNGLDSVQLTGGEAVLHPEFWSMVDFLYREPRIKKIYLPTNGIAFADPTLAARLADYRDRIMVLLQFDGPGATLNQAMRGANPERLRERAIANLGQLRIQMQLTMTLSQGVNEEEIGWVVEMGLRHDHVKVIAMQPATYSGRYDLEPDALSRLTLSDVVKGVVSQVRRRLRVGDFVPIPCSHPNCGWITLFVRRFGLVANIARHVDLGRVMDQVGNRTLLRTEELREVVGTKRTGAVAMVAAAVGRKLIRSTDVFGIAIKPFMDRFSYDQDRISSCCHHLLDTHGRPVSFCEYNARVRPGDSWNRFPMLREGL